MFFQASLLRGDLKVKRDRDLPNVFHVYYKDSFVGMIRGNSYVTRRNYYDHFFRKYNGYAISKRILNMLKKHGVTKIVIIEEKDGGERLLISDIDSWLKHGATYVFRFPDGYKDEQLVLPLYYMVAKQ